MAGELLAGDLVAVLQAVADGVVVFDEAGRVVLINEAAVRLGGFPEVAVAHAYFEHIAKGPPPDVRLLGADGRALPYDAWPLTKARRGEAFRETEVTLVREGSAARKTGVFTGTMVERSGGGRLLVTTLRDVTAQREAEASLRASDERHLLAGRATRDVIWDWDPQARRIAWSGSGIELFGHPPAPDGTTYAWCVEQVHPEDRERIDAGLRRALAGDDELWQAEHRFRRADGTFADVFDRGCIVRDAGGHLVRMVGVMTDVSPLRAAEAALRATRERLDLAHRLAGTGAWDVDLATRRFWCSPELAAIFGRDPPPTTIDEADALVHPQDLPRLRARVAETVAGGGDCDLEFRVLHPALGVRWLQALGRVSRDADGRPRRLSGITLDVTERRLAAAERERLLALADAARAAAELARDDLGRMIERMSDAFVSLDHAGRLTWLNGTALGIAGRPREALIGHTPAELFPELEGSEAVAALGRAVAGQRPSSFELAARSGNFYSVRVFPSPEGLSILAQDVTERRRAEEALARRTAQLRDITDAVPVRIGHFDTDERFDFMNAAYERHYGVSFDPAGSMRVRDLLGEATYARAEGSIRRVLAGETVRFENRGTLPDGDEWFADVALVPHRAPAGAVVGAYVVAADITPLKRAEAALRDLNRSLEARVAERTAQLEEQAARLRLLAAELTDSELRARRRLAEVVHDHLQQLLVAARMRLAAAARLAGDEAARRMLDDTGQILGDAIDVSRSLAVELQPPVLFERGLAAALRWLAGWVREQHGLELALSIHEGVEPADEGTRALLFTAVRELLFNVVKHAGVQRARVVMRSARGGCVRVAVIDAGRGFAVDDGMSRGGFGLFSIGERLRALGGDVTVRSRPGAGTRVDLLLPRATGATPHTVRRPAPLRRPRPPSAPRPTA